MNFLKAVIEKKGSGYVAQSCGGSFAVLPERVPKDVIAKYAGKEVVLGIRPEDLHLDPDFLKKSTVGVITSELELSEMMGSEAYLYLKCEDNSLIAKVPARFNPQSESGIQVALDCTKLHIFDPETEQNIVSTQ